uniref:Uncharacterized protein n=1 Tax=Opuntia streptacantha TaxID=393608 RepID=A0A7C8YF60_OPUST
MSLVWSPLRHAASCTISPWKSDSFLSSFASKSLSLTGSGNVSGQSVLGVVLFKTISKVPAQASLLVRKFFKLKIFFTVAGIEECSYCDVGCGPDGVCSTACNFHVQNVYYFSKHTEAMGEHQHSNFNACC